MTVPWTCIRSADGGNGQTDPPISLHNSYFHFRSDATGRAIDTGQSQPHAHFKQLTDSTMATDSGGCQVCMLSLDVPGRSLHGTPNQLCVYQYLYLLLTVRPPASPTFLVIISPPSKLKTDTFGGESGSAPSRLHRCPARLHHRHHGEPKPHASLAKATGPGLRRNFCPGKCLNLVTVSAARETVAEPCGQKEAPVPHEGCLSGRRAERTVPWTLGFNSTPS